MALTCSGQVQIFLYDIEGSGTLSRGRNYPAVKQRVAADSQGTLCRSMSKFHNNVAYSFIMCARYIIGTDVLPESIRFHLRNCSVETFPLLIRAKCPYPGDSGAMVTGFQVIAQPADFDGLGKLYAGHTLQCQTSAIVEVEQNGEFQVSVIPVLGETGIVNSSVEYSEVVVVEDLLTATGTLALDIKFVCHPIIIGPFMTFICIGTTAVDLDTGFVKDVFLVTAYNDSPHNVKNYYYSGAAIGILLLLVIILCGIILILCGKKCDRKLKPR